MKKTFLHLLLITVLFVYQATAQVNNEGPPHSRDSFKISPLHFFIDNTLSMSYEKMSADIKQVTDKQAGYQFSGSFTSKKTDNDDGLNKNNTSLSGFGLEFQYRKYIIRSNMNDPKGFYFNGLYAGPFFSYNRNKYKREFTENQNTPIAININQSEILNSYSAGAIFGVQFSIEDKFFLDLYVGGGARHNVSEGDKISPRSNFLDVGYSGVLPKLGFDLGVGF